MKFLTSDPFEFRDTGDDYVAEVFSDEIEIYKEPVEKIFKKQPRKESRVIGEKIKSVANDFKHIDPFQKVITQQQNVTDKVFSQTKNTKKPENSNKIVLIDLVEQVPIFPGCENMLTNNERKICMSKKISKLIQRKFNTNIGEGLGLTGKQTIHVQFKIDQTGNVADIKTNAKYKELEKEAKRVIAKIPTMKPGKQQNKNVSVMYSLPIAFQVF